MSATVPTVAASARRTHGVAAAAPAGTITAASARRTRVAATLTVAALCAVAPASAEGAPTKEVQGPVAVMPFKNLVSDPDLEWLSVGIAETMISDMRKANAIEVVERSQLDQALAELALQGLNIADESTAARVGRMVGARTIVVGGYQTAGKRLRITARFVSVETGVVVGAAKVTGRTQKVLELQDAIVAELLGRKPGPKKKKWKPPRKRRSNDQEVKAYRFYAMSLTTSSSVQRIGYLKKAIEIDPHFEYALDDLKALEARMEGYRRAADQVLEERLSAERAKVADPKRTPAERLGDLRTLIYQLLGKQDYTGIFETARWAEKLDWPREVRPSVDELLLAERFRALYTLQRYSIALQLGEAYLKQFPDGPNYTTVDQLMEAAITQERFRQEKRAKWAEELAEIEADEEELARDREQNRQDLADGKAAVQAAETDLEAARARLQAILAEAPAEPGAEADREARNARRVWERRHRQAERDAGRAERTLKRARSRLERAVSKEVQLGVRRQRIDHAWCIEAERSDMMELALDRCRAFVKKYADQPAWPQQIPWTKVTIFRVLFALGRFDEARAVGEALLEESDDASLRTSVKAQLKMTPKGWDGKL